MIARTGKSSRKASACVLVSLLLLPSSIVGQSSEQEFRSTATAMPGTEAAVKGGDSSTLDLEGRAEARTEEETTSRDSYIEALKHSRTSTDPREGVVAGDDPRWAASLRRRKDQPRSPVYAAKRAQVLSGRDTFSPIRSDSSSLPSRTAEDFHGVRNSYGPPQPPQPPRDSYGPAYNDYSPYGEYATPGLNSIQQNQGYGQPVAAYDHGVSHGVAHAMSQSVHLGFPSIDFSWPFALKLNAFTLAKIILKLVIFKMIVKFIAIICLLLFIPKLEIKKGNKGSMESDDDDDGDERSRSMNAESMAWNRLNLLTFLVDDALGRYRNANELRSGSRDECSTLECRVLGTLDREKSWPDYENLLRGYLLEETRLFRGKS